MRANTLPSEAPRGVQPGLPLGKFMEVSVRIRRMEERDVELVSALCMRSFARSVASTVSEEGLSSFSRVADGAAFLGRMKADTLMLVAEDDEAIRGVIELKEGRHLAMLFVDPDHQRKGVGRRLLSAALGHARVDTVTVRASLSSVPAYEKYGFECTGEVGESAGLTYQPMALQRDRWMLSAASAD